MAVTVSPPVEVAWAVGSLERVVGSMTADRIANRINMLRWRHGPPGAAIGGADPVSAHCKIVV